MWLLRLSGSVSQPCHVHVCLTLALLCSPTEPPPNSSAQRLHPPWPHWPHRSFSINVVLMMISGFFVNGPYALITTAVSADLGSHESLQVGR